MKYEISSDASWDRRAHQTLQPRNGVYLNDVGKNQSPIKKKDQWCPLANHMLKLFKNDMRIGQWKHFNRPARVVFQDAGSFC